MKNLTKIFMAVAVALFAFSCVTDATEDLGVKLEGQGVTELTISLEESRTQLGDKVVNEDGTSLYPLYWSEGDAIAVNGVRSYDLKGVAESAVDATFSFGQEIARPYCVVYPAQSGVGEGTVYPVTFAATQPYTAGSFAPQSAPMYGYAAALAEGEEESAVQLQHLTGVLRLALAGNGEKVTSIRVKAEKGKIAGDFTVDCSNGTLTASESASDTLTVTFEEGLVLGAEAAPVYVAVPSGNYGTLLITIYTEAHQKMTVQFSSEFKPINAGSVREFSAITYEANTADENNAEFLIETAEDLIEFANIAPKFYPRTKATVVAEIDMTGKEWTPIASFGEYEFDGGNYAIKGLSAPLFDMCAATVKNVKLVDVNYTVTDLAFSGAIACRLYGDMENCSAAGTININCAELVIAEPYEKYNDICHGGLAGYISGVAVTNCTNDIDITITSLCAEGGIPSTVGGVVGGVSNSCSFDKVINNGDIEYVATNQTANLYISGIAGKNDNTSDADFVSVNNCTNNGKLSTSKESSSTADILLSGITGQLIVDEATVCTNLVNNAPFTHNGTCNNPSLAGISSYNSVGSFANCSNTAALTVADGAIAKGNTIVCGLFGHSVTTGGMRDCSNSGALTIVADYVATGKVVLVGIANVITTSNSAPEITGITNSAPISLSKWSNTTAGGNGGRILVGGLFQSINAGKVSKCYNEATGTISVSNGKVAAIQMVGGIAAYLSTNSNAPIIYISECENKAAINITSTDAVGKASEIGGLIGEAYINQNNDTFSAEIDNCKNSGSITVSGTHTSSPHIGGCMGINNYDTIKLTNYENTGNITYSGTSPYANLGGIVGYDGSNYAFTIDGCTNSGIVKCTSVMSSGIRMGGIVGTYNRDHSSKTAIKNCTNLGTIALEGEQTVSAEAYSYILGGIVGYCSDAGLTIEKCYNGSSTDATKGTVTAGTAPSGIGVAGICGISTSALTISECINYGAISQTGKGGYNATYRAHIAGMIGQCAKYLTVTDCKNFGAISYGPIQAANKVDVAGICGETSTNGGLISGCENSGTIKITAPTAAETNLAGIIGMAQTGTTVSNCKNLATGIISYEGTHSGSTMCVGGIAGSTNAASVKLLYCYNYGTIQQTKTTNTAGNLYIGGINGYPYIAGTIQYCGNHGPVITNSASLIYMGGVAGYPRTGASETGNNIIDCYNAYDLVFTGTATKTIYAGGVIGAYDMNKEVVPVMNNLVNLGNITYKGTATTEKIGGIIAHSTNGPLSNCQSYAKITAIGKSGKVGAIMGQAYAEATAATNCKVGGSFVFEQETSSDAAGNDETYDVVTTLTADNYIEYVYSAAITAEQATTDGCSLLTEKPSLPVYTAEE